MNLAWLLFAQVDPLVQLGGNSGWAGAGLLGVVLAWLLLWHIPEKDKQFNALIAAKDLQLKDFINSKDTHTTNMSKEQRDEIRKLQDSYKESISLVIAHCEKGTASLTEALHREFDILTKTIAQLEQTVSRCSFQPVQVSDPRFNKNQNSQ